MDADLEAYIAAIDPAHRALFDRIDGLILEAVPEATVGMSYNMPVYRLGRHALNVGVWKHGVSLYGWGQGGDTGFIERHPSVASGKGTIRLSRSAADEVADEELIALFRAALTG